MLDILLDPETMVPLGFGVTSILTLTVAMATDYWLVVWDEGPHPYQADTQWCSFVKMSADDAKYPTESADTIFHSMVKPAVACGLAWGLLLGAVIWSTVDNCRRGNTVGGALLYACGGLSLGAGCIAFISAINEYTFLRLQLDERANMEHFGFSYEYEWSSLYLLPVCVTSAFCALITNTMVYARRYFSLAKRAQVRTRDYLTPIENV